jgi:hypothetical protein
MPADCRKQQEGLKIKFYGWALTKERKENNYGYAFEEPASGKVPLMQAF